MTSKIKLILKLLALAFACLMLYAGWIKIRSLNTGDSGLPLAVRWEGFYHDMNLRDIGASANQCLGREVFRTGLVLRSAGWFSGWDCDKVDNPDVIYSLNFSPEKQERYFCQSEEGKRIGRFTNPATKLNNLEYLETWSDDDMRNAACRFFREIFVSILDEEKTLMHCDAGRDRTGTFTALLLALAAEQKGELDQGMLDAIECDYRKTESLVEDKYGRMESFIRSIQKQGGVIRFFEQRCGIPAPVSSAVGDQLLADVQKR